MRAVTLKNEYATYIIHLQRGGGYKVGHKEPGIARVIATNITEDDAYKEIGYLIINENCRVTEVLR